MKLRQRVMSMLLTVAMISGLAPVLTGQAKAATSGTCGENLTWTLDSEGTLTISGTGKMEDYTEQDEYTGETDSPWDARRDIKKIFIESGVTSIGDYAFVCCSSLTSVNISNSVISIGDCAFSGCSGLISFNIPSSVISIGGNTFASCTGLTSINIPNSVTSIGEYAFCFCSNLTSIDIPNSVTSIEMGTFVGSGLTSIDIPNSVISIGRKGHDMRYAIDPTKIHNELGWLPETKFADGIKKTIQWYLDNKEWWETIISGEYQNYYEKMYGNR